MDEMIEITVEKVVAGISGWSWTDQAFMLGEIAEKLKEAAHECLCMEYGFTEENI
jgi:hypothetical protein